MVSGPLALNKGNWVHKKMKGRKKKKKREKKIV